MEKYANPNMADPNMANPNMVNPNMPNPNMVNPNMAHVQAHAHAHESQEWGSSFWSCCSPCGTCLCANFLPCFLYGKTQARVKDPSLSDFSHCNWNCCGWLCLAYCGVSGILQTIKRIEMREKYGIKGSGVMDCLGSCCCPCCALVQEDKETKRRAEASGYQRTAPMAYK